MKVLIPQDITCAGKDYLRGHGYEVVVLNHHDEHSIIQAVSECDAILSRTAKITRVIMEHAPKLKVISRHGVGVDHIDLDAATELGIWVTNGPLSNYETVAEHTIAFILALGHRLAEMDEQVRSGNWDARNTRLIHEAGSKTLGILGLGRIGKAVAQRAALGLGMKVIGYDILPDIELPDYITRLSSPEEVFGADYVSLHIPATDITRNSINKSRFDLMHPHSYLINCARGEILNEDDLYCALTTGKIAGAALDVLQSEPPSPDNPLLTLENVIFSPHNAALTQECYDKMGLHAAQGIHEVLSDKTPTWPVNCVDGR